VKILALDFDSTTNAAYAFLMSLYAEWLLQKRHEIDRFALCFVDFVNLK